MLYSIQIGFLKTKMNQDVYIIIGNTDGRLSTKEWDNFQAKFKKIVVSIAEKVWGIWYSDPTTPFRNMCIGVLLAETNFDHLKRQLRRLATQYHQDSIVWSEAKTEFLQP